MMLYVFIASSVVAIALIGLLAWQSRKRLPHPPAPAAPSVPQVKVSQKTAEQLEQELEQAFRQQIQTSTATFAQDLTETSQMLSKQVQRLTVEVITRELDQYTETLEKVRSIAEGAAKQIQSAVAQQEADLQKALEAAVASEQQRRLNQIDAQLGNIISAYLVEALGSEVDLGAQTAYILQSLESHKDDIKKDLTGGV